MVSIPTEKRFDLFLMLSLIPQTPCIIEERDVEMIDVGNFAVCFPLSSLTHVIKCDGTDIH